MPNIFTPPNFFLVQNRVNKLGLRMFSAVFLIAAFSVSALENQSSQLDAQIQQMQLDMPRMREIFQLVAMNEGQPTKQIHDEFWGLIFAKIHEDPKVLKGNINQGLTKMVSWQIALWDSIRLSVISGKVIQTNELIEASRNIPLSKITANYMYMQDAMLKAAATGQPYITTDGKSLMITKEMAEKNLANMQASKRRLEKLCDPDWK